MYDIVVVGSGLSSLCFLNGFNKKDQKIAMISYTANSEKNNNENKLNKFQLNEKILPPRFTLNNEKIKDVKNYFIKNKIIFDKNTSIFGLLDEGGVSNHWGCSCQFLDEKNINFLSKENKSALIKSFLNYYNNFNFTGIYNYNNKNFFFKKKKISSFFKNIMQNCKTEDIEFYENCTATNNTNNTLFIPKNIKELIYKKINLLNYFVKKISKQDNYYQIICETNETEIEIKTKKLVLGAGTIATTSLVCEMLNYDQNIKIDHNPMLFGALISKESFDDDNFLPSEMAAEIKSKEDGLISLANFRGSNDIINHKIKNNFFFMKNPLSQKIYNLLKNKIIYINLYLDSDYGNLNINFKNKETAIISSDKKKIKTIKKELFKSFNKIYDSLKRKKIIYPIKYSFVPEMGNDNHYTGTIPINNNHEKLSLNENCELKNYKGLYIIDGSAIPKNSLKFPTGLIMANAHRIGEII